MREEQLTEALLGVISEPSRRFLLAEIQASPKNVTQLVQATGLKQPNVSNHLRRLREQGLVQVRRVGREKYYSLADPAVEEALRNLLVPPPTSDPAEIRIDRDFVQRFSDAVVQGDEANATLIVDRLMRSGVPVLEIYERVFAASLHQIGDWWHAQRIDVGQEHIASALIERLMGRIMLYARTQPSNGLRCLVGCCAGSEHSMGARMVSDVMRLLGWKSVFLGANVPRDSFVRAVEHHHPHLVMVSASLREQELELKALLADLVKKRSERAFALVVGGQGAEGNPDYWLAQGAEYVPSNLTELREYIAQRFPAPQEADPKNTGFSGSS